MTEYSYDQRIPKDRVAVLIGKNGKVKKQIAELTKIKIDVDSGEGDVTLSGDDALNLFTTKEIIKAIGRGFNPDIALLLIKQDYSFELIDITEYDKGKNHLKRLKGRIIGAEGKARKIIEDLTETYISVYGKTVGIIGLPESVAVARKALESLLSGSPHSSVYKWLEKNRRDLKQGNLL